jgi:hypothetical protein
MQKALPKSSGALETRANLLITGLCHEITDRYVVGTIGMSLNIRRDDFVTNSHILEQSSMTP